MNPETVRECVADLLQPPENDPDHPVDFELYQYAAGEATAQDRAAFLSHLNDCPACQRALERFHDEESERSRVWRPRWWLSLGVAAAVAASLLVVLLPPDATDPAMRARVKGGFALHVAVERRGRVLTAHSGDGLQTGDRLGFFYSAQEPGYLVLLALDSKGTVTRLYPHGAAARLPAGVQLRLPDGAVVEPGPACEWLIGLYGAAPVAWNDAEDAARDALQNREDCNLGAIHLEGVLIDLFLIRRGT